LPVPAKHLRRWSPEDPQLYDLKLELIDARGRVVDAAQSHAGLRSVTIEGMAVKLNGRAVFQRLVLDQGYYPDGILTAPSEAALVRDITLAPEAGFNGARLHQKVVEERFLYHADRLGDLVWGEFSDWGLHGSLPVCRWQQEAGGKIVRAGNHRGPDLSPGHVTQWLEAVQHVSTTRASSAGVRSTRPRTAATSASRSTDDVMRVMVLATKLTDPTRPHRWSRIRG
jgi:beta-galactosidase/beta-glucuronidase